MSQVNYRFPGFGKPGTDHQTNNSAPNPNDECKPIELRILMDGKVYRSKAEQERLIVLGQWHHRRARRRQRYSR